LQKKQLQKTVCGYDCKKIEKQLKKTGKSTIAKTKFKKLHAMTLSDCD
jgi:hypothetical protein